MRAIAIALVAALAFITGCAQRDAAWYKATGTDAEFHQTRFACLERSAVTVPEAPAPAYSPTYGSGSFGSSIGEAARTAQQGSANRAVERRREQLFAACMQADGWRLIDQ